MSPTWRQVYLPGGGSGDGGMTDALKLAVRITDPLAAQTEAALYALRASYPDTLAAQAELLKLGIRGLADANAAPAEALAGAAITWGSTTANDGTAPTNPANAIGQNNGTLANVKVGGIPGGAASGLRVMIPFASIVDPDGGAGTKVIRAYYRTNREVTGLLDTFTMAYTSLSGVPTTVALPEGNFLTTPFEAAITYPGDGSQAITFSFQHTALIAATSGSIDIDAVAIRSTGAL